MQAVAATMRKHYARGGRDKLTTLEKDFVIFAKKANWRRCSGPMFVGLLGMGFGHRIFPFTLMPRKLAIPSRLLFFLM